MNKKQEIVAAFEQALDALAEVKRHLHGQSDMTDEQITVALEDAIAALRLAGGKT